MFREKLEMKMFFLLQEKFHRFFPRKEEENLLNTFSFVKEKFDCIQNVANDEL
jgi:hypothetical protein